MGTSTIEYKTPRGTKRTIHIEFSTEFGINASATGEIEPDVARRLAHALLHVADQVEYARREATPVRVGDHLPNRGIVDLRYVDTDSK